MPTKSTVQSPRLRDRSDAIRDEIERLQSKLDFYENLPKDDYANGAVLVFEKKFNETGITYTYAAVKGGNFWYLTNQTAKFTWDNLLDHLFGNLGEGGYVSAYWASELTEAV